MCKDSIDNNKAISAKSIDEVYGQNKKISTFVLIYIFIALAFVSIGPAVFTCNWISSSDFHSCIEITGSFFALVAGVVCLTYFFALRKRFYLIVGLGFLIAGSEDLAHGILSWSRLFEGTTVELSRFIPGTYVAGRIVLASMIIAAQFLDQVKKKVMNEKREAFIFAVLAVLFGGGITVVAFEIYLPRFIFPERLISRPVDLLSAIIFLIAFFIILNRYLVKRDIFSGMLLASILFNIGAQIYMSFSKSLYDIFFDVAHWGKVFGYTMPILGISTQILREMKMSEVELYKRKHVERELQKAKDNLEIKVDESTAELSSSNTRLEDEIVQRTSAQRTSEERIREINCLYSLSKLVEQPGIPLGAIFQRTTELIRNAYQYPDITCVRITFNGVKYQTDNFDKSELSQHAQIRVGGEEAGDIEVYYLGEEAEAGESPFLQEESDLLDAVAEHLGRIAERTQAGEKLQLFRNLIDRSNDCIFVMELKWGRFLDVNDKACESLGYTREELLTMSLKDIEESIRDESAWQQQAEELKVKSDLVIQGRHKCKDATTFYAETSLKYVSQGKEDYIIAVARDITERKQTEEKLKQAAEEWITTFNSITDLVSIQDKDFKLVRVNKAFADAFKAKPEELIGKHCYEIIHGTKEPPAVCPHKQTLDTKKAQRGELFEPHLGIFVEASTSPIFDENGDIIASVHITKDITERKQAEEKQAGLLETVESINKELKDFAYIVSHDLKAPLRGIKTLADWIATDYADMFDEEGKERVSLLLGRTVRMHNLIDGILQYSRVGREKVKRVRVNLNVLISEVIEAIVPPENIEITVENELPVIECEETRIMQVFQNLLSNAVKYMDKPQGRIRIDCVQENGFWKFSVTDNGPGIEEAHYERIFQIFQTLSPRDEVESTGVGLSVVKKIVELYGGKIWVESKPGEGSTFFFTLPKQESEVVDDAQLEANIVS